MARALSVDAVEFRMRHLKDERIRAVLQAAAKKIRLAETVCRRPRAWDCLWDGKGWLYRDCGRGRRRPATASRSNAIVIAFECGAIVNPDGLNNQVEGSVVQGLGGALFEAIEFANGKLQNGTMSLYRVPRFRDTPPIEVVLLDRPDLALGGRG